VSADDKFQILSQVEMANRHVPKLVMCKNWTRSM
jgi:hypothetical protein